MQEQLFKAIYDMKYIWLKMKKAAAELLAARGFGAPLKTSPFPLFVFRPRPSVIIGLIVGFGLLNYRVLYLYSSVCIM